MSVRDTRDHQNTMSVTTAVALRPPSGKSDNPGREPRSVRRGGLRVLAGPVMVAVAVLLAAVAAVPATAGDAGLEVYISDAGGFNQPPWQILKVDGNGENPTVFIADELNWPQDIIFRDDSGTVLISNLGSGRITVHDADTGAFVEDFATGLAGPTRMKLGPDGLLYVLQWNGQGIVLRYELDGTFVDEFTSVGVPRSIGLDWDAEGNLYVSSYNQDLVRRYDPDGEDLGVFIDSDLAGPTNIWFDSTGDLLVVDYDGTAVKRFSPAGEYLGDFMVGLRFAEGFDFLPNGDILIGNGSDSTVKRYAADGTFIEDFVASGTAGLQNPNAIVVRGGTPEAPTAAFTTEVEGLTVTFTDESEGDPIEHDARKDLDCILQYQCYRYGLPLRSR